VDGGSTTVDNTGSISASGHADGGEAEVYGVVGIAGLDVGITNAGDIGASVDADDAVAVAVLANSYIGQAAVQNDRSIHAYATGGTASATGASMLATLGDADNGNLEATLVNHGDIVATAQGDTATTAIGATLTGRDAGSVQIDNDGRIAASAEGGQAAATAVSADAVGSIVLGNTGGIVASARGDDATAIGIAAVSHAGDGVQVDNGKTISAAAYGAQGTATGISLDAYGSVALTNSGAIVAMSEGDGAVGVDAVSRHGGGLNIDNTGSIVATAKGGQAQAIAVSMDSGGGATLDNRGTIAAYGNGVAVASGKDTSATIVNHGAITGAITGGDLDDSFENAAGAAWRATGSSDFGAGDDHIVNHGTLYMQDAQILLGGYTGGNTFENTGTLFVKGAGNVIDMDNPFPIENNGLIDLANGVAGDVLTLKGDLDGKGSIAVDASALNGSMDRLDIRGRVFDTARQTVDVNLLDAPHAASVTIPFLQASGEPVGDFTLGNVRHAGGGFVSLGFNLRSDADPTDVTRKLLSLEVDVTGLNAAGSLAAALAPGVQSLVDAQVGTWRQRAGVVPRAEGARLAPWVRTFASSGGVDPGYSGSLGSAGGLDFQQSNQGLELGVDTKVSEHLSVGVLVATAQGRQHLDGVSGNDRFDDRAYGVYATWLAGQGFYLDVSQRWNSVDAKLSAGAQGYTADASASTFNVETGFTAWKLGRIGIGPQLQYTRTRVDDIDPLREGAATFDEKGGTASRGRLGVALDGHFRGLGFDWTPYGSVNVVREFSSRYGYAVNDGILGAVDTRGTSALIEAGLGARKGGFSATAGVQWSDGGALRSVTGGQLTLHYDW
jgi:outer membrane autotransporter protein